MITFIYEWVAIRLFKRYIEDHRRDAVKKSMLLLADWIKFEISKKGWTRDEQMVAPELADIVDGQINKIIELTNKEMR